MILECFSDENCFAFSQTVYSHENMMKTGGKPLPSLQSLKFSNTRGDENGYFGRWVLT